jgi:hypothetical protein
MTETEIGRLAFREESGWWNAYWVPGRDSMTSAVQLGSIRMSVAHGRARELFMKAMTEALSAVVKDTIGHAAELTWNAERE